MGNTPRIVGYPVGGVIPADRVAAVRRRRRRREALRNFFRILVPKRSPSSWQSGMTLRSEPADQQP